MITDKENTFADRLRPVATGVVGDVVKVNHSHRNINLNCYVQVETDFDALTSYAFEFWAGPNADGSSARTIASSGAIALATLNADAGYRFTAGLGDLSTTEAYVGLKATLVGTAPAVGAITAGITEVGRSDLATRPSGFTGY